MKRLALIPARGGSKGLPRKNLAVVGGSTLLERAVTCAIEAAIFDAVVVSTDDPAIAEAGRKAGALVPFLRPRELADDSSPILTTIHHALVELEAGGKARFDLIALLEPTSPRRTPEIVRRVVAAAEEPGTDAALTVSPVPERFHPLKQFVNENGRVRHYLPEGVKITRRQELTPTYIRNGMCYATRREALDAGLGVLGSSAVMVVVPGPVVNIDSMEDLELARRLLEAESRA